jgi:uncharacterized protein YhbP (UPF0306 family)
MVRYNIVITMYNKVMDYEKRAAEIIQQIQYTTLATVTPEGLPWNSPVARVYDQDLNFYWFSDKEGQHSKNVRANGQVFIVIYNSTVPWGEGEGVYFQADVVELTDSDEVRAARRLSKGPNQDAPDDFMGSAVRRVYKATPRKAWMNDVEIDGTIFIRDIRVELNMDKLRYNLVSE